MPTYPWPLTQLMGSGLGVLSFALSRSLLSPGLVALPSLLAGMLRCAQVRGVRSPVCLPVSLSPFVSSTPIAPLHSGQVAGCDSRGARRGCARLPAHL